MMGRRTSKLTMKLTESQRFTLTIVALASVSLTVSLSSTSMSNAVPVITSQFHGTDVQAFWSGTANLLCSAVFQPAFAVFSYIFGRKPLFIIASLLFLAGSALATGSQNFDVLLVARSIQGFGGGGLLTLSEILIADLTPLSERGKWIGILSMMWAIGCVTGPVVGGALAHRDVWRWIFALNLPLASISLALICISVQPRTYSTSFYEESTKQKLGRVDWIGFGLFIPSISSFLIPLTWGGELFDWKSWHTLVPLLVGVAGLAAFVIYEMFIAKEPFLLKTIFRDWNAKLVYVQTFLHGLIVWCLLYYLPLYYQAVKSYSALMSGVALLPETFSITLAAGLVGFVIASTGRYREVLTAGWVVATTSLGTLYLLDVHTAIYQWVLINFFVGMGTGSLFTSLNLAVQSNIAPHEVSHALGFFAFFRALGQAIGVAIGGATFDNIFRSKLAQNAEIAAYQDQLSKGAAALIEILKTIPDSDPRKPALIQTYADSLRLLWPVMCGCAGLALLFSLFIRHHNLRRDGEEEYATDTPMESIEELGHGHFKGPKY
ncbi:unnamed protein product [Penicillium salamii]|uniref:Major facilitator superfamily (MFS) profile domain-containing protein n=1 Tax=Penicillium salamii TaxID=1612424 RepID=A0A9W4JGB6_9EURO|nr:unnamed protein product [Penicillium salamii]CAG8363083.1 unnamed protein product [Penicillium salamii]CAG8388792.1 unnamed protein product [Penicillium salamii]CAG8392152.1 unnamed protein product [Penicillium salamii]